MTVEHTIAEASKIFQYATIKEFGCSAATSRELGILKKLYRELRSREAIVRYIVEQGFPHPTKRSGQEIGLMAAMHGCVVAEHIIQERLTITDADKADPDLNKTGISYGEKSRFDRYVRERLSLRENFKRGSE